MLNKQVIIFRKDPKSDARGTAAHRSFGAERHGVAEDVRLLEEGSRFREKRSSSMGYKDHLTVKNKVVLALRTEILDFKKTTSSLVRSPKRYKLLLLRAKETGNRHERLSQGSSDNVDK